MSAPRLPSSLASRLTHPLVTAVVTVWALSTALVVWYVDAQIQRNFDTELIESAHRQLYPALLDIKRARRKGIDLDQHPVTMGEAPGEMGADDSPEPLILQMRAPEGQVLLRSRGAPGTPFDVPLTPGFHNSRDHRIYTLYTAQDELWLQLADPLTERVETSRRTLTGLAMVLLLMLPVLGLLIRHIARKELRSVQWLQQQITDRSSNNLQPLSLDGLPQELHQVGDGVNQLMQRLHQALDVERALAANAAHELRTPLASVRLRLHTAIEQARAHRQEAVPVHDAQMALTALETLSHRTERLLQLSRAESGNAARFHSMDLVQLASTMAQEFWQQPRAQRRLDWEAPEDGAVWVQGDMDTLAIALRNLIDNALTYSSGEVTLAVSPQPPALVVRDHGPGLTAPQQERIMERHVRADTQHTGYGLGMSIVRSIADKHGAQLVLTSPPPGQSQGLEVRLEFSVAGAAADVSAA